VDVCESRGPEVCHMHVHVCMEQGTRGLSHACACVHELEDAQVHVGMQAFACVHELACSVSRATFPPESVCQGIP